MSGISKPLPLRKDIAFSFGLTKILRNVKKKKKIFNFQFSKRKLKKNWGGGRVVDGFCCCEKNEEGGVKYNIF